MKNEKLRRKLFLLLVAVLCLVPQVSVTQESDTASTARQKLGAANDKAESPEEKRAALETLEDAVRLFLSSGESVEAARALNRVGRLQLDLNEPKKAIESHSQALNLLKQSPSNDTVDNLNGLAAAHMYLNEFGSAEKSLGRAIRISERSGYTAGQADALLTLSDRQNYKNHVDALAMAEKALTLFEKISDKDGIAKTYAQIGQYNLAMQRLVESKQSYEKALALRLELNDARGQADALIYLGFIEHRKGYWEGAINYYRQAQVLLTSQSDPLRMGQIFMGYAEAFSAGGMPDTGLSYFQQGLDYYRETQRPDLITYAIWGIGRNEYLRGNYSESKRQLELALSNEPSDSIQAAQCHQFLAGVYIKLNAPTIALEHLDAALPVFEGAENPEEVAQVRGLMGQVFEQQGDLERARKQYQQASAIFMRLQDKLSLSVIYFAQGRLELKQDNLNAAETYLKKSIDDTESMRRVSTSSNLTAAFSATVHERYESYIDCLMRKEKIRKGQSLDVLALETSEQSRGRSLVELLRATQTVDAPGVDQQTAEQERSLRQSLRVKEDSRINLLATEYKKEELDSIDGEVSQLEAQYKQLIETIRARYPAFEQISRPSGWTVRQIQERVVVDDETLLLEYSLGAERSYVWTVTRDRVTSYELPSENLISAAAQNVYRLLATRPGSQPANELDQAVRELSQMVLLPVAQDLNKRRILIVADGALNYIPFQILPMPSGDGQQLVARHEVINAPSASILGQLRQETARRQPAANILAAFGDPIFAANYAERKDLSDGQQLAYVQTQNNERMRTALRDVELNGDSFDPSVIQPLFYAKHELANLREVAGDETLLATGFDATREKLQTTDLTKYSVLHFATHGVLDPKQPENSGLFLSTINRNGQTQDGFFGLADIYNLHAPVDLVVLSACRTGLGKDIRGEGLIGITRGFMYAGASSVVASLWKVDDEATAELMKIFYTNLLERGMTPAASLSGAQNSIRQQQRWRSPYYWAAFTIQGDSRTVIRAKRTSAPKSYESFVVLLSLGGLLAIVIWSYRCHVRGMI